MNPIQPIQEPAPEIRLSEVLSAMSFALDITEGQPIGHSVRSCLIGMRVAEVAGVPDDVRSALFYALLLKDLGCSSNSARICSLFGADDLMAKRQHKLADWSRWFGAARYVVRVTDETGSPLRRAVRLMKLGVVGESSAREVTAIRCERGADIATMLGFPLAMADAIRTLDEHWDGNGYPEGLRGPGIPLLGRIVCLAQTVEVFFTTFGVDAAMDVVSARRGTWFDPELADAMLSLRGDAAFWQRLGAQSLLDDVVTAEPREAVSIATEEHLDRVAEAFARVIDAKSPWTARHSERVSEIATSIAAKLGYGAAGLRSLRWAALLHDIGKLGVSNLILDKQGRLTDAELVAVRRHPEYTVEILRRVAPFRSIAEDAGAHHERLDGTGYHRGVGADQLTQPARILAVADVYEALSAKRPYRESLPPDRVLAMIRGDAPHALCAECVDALDTMTGSARAT